MMKAPMLSRADRLPSLHDDSRMDRLIFVVPLTMLIACSTADERRPTTESGVWTPDDGDGDGDGDTGTSGDETGGDTGEPMPMADLPPANEGCDFAALLDCTAQAGGELGQCLNACPQGDGCDAKACEEGCEEQRWRDLGDCYEATGCEAELEAEGFDPICTADAWAMAKACFEACVDGGAGCYVIRAEAAEGCW